MAGGRAGVADLCGSGFLSARDHKSPAELKAALAGEAHRLGFDCLGVASPDTVGAAAKHFYAFLEAGAHGDMDWLAANPERRADPRGLWRDVRSVIMLGVNYGPDEDPLEVLKERSRAAISVYAKGDDYHDVIKKRLKALGRWLVAATPC
jgi:epoxyqueuosine reductase